jgi:hypothetical protein
LFHLSKGMDAVSELLGPYFRMPDYVQSLVAEAIQNVISHRPTALEST